MKIYIYVGLNEVKKRFLSRLDNYYLISGASVEREGNKIFRFNKEDSNGISYRLTLPTGSILLLDVNILNVTFLFMFSFMVVVLLIESKLLLNSAWLMVNINKMDLKLEPVVKIHANAYDNCSYEEVIYYEVLSKFSKDGASAFPFISKLNKKGLCGFYTYYMLSNSELTYGINVGVNIDIDNLCKYGEKIFELFGNKESVCIELTEKSSGINYSNKIKEVVLNYKRQGFKFALDDFGEGVNNLDSIEIVSPDSIKISRNLLVSNDGLDESTLAIMDVIKSKYGMSVICEGVENKKLQLDLLSRNYLLHQGYLYN